MAAMNRSSLPATLQTMEAVSEEEELQTDLAKQCDCILETIKSGHRPLSVLVTGGSQNGKSSLVKAIFGEEVARNAEGQKIATGSNGKPVTQDVTAYTNPKGTLQLIDTPGLEKNHLSGIVPRIQKQMKEKKLKPSIIWIVLNTQTSIEDVELELIKLAPGVPTIIILNKCDFLQRRKHELQHDSTCLEQFDQLLANQLPTWMKNNKGLMAKRDRLLAWKQEHESVRRVLIMSLGDSDQFVEDGKPDEAIGLDILLAATWGCLDDVGRIQLAEIQYNSKIGKIQASVAIITGAMASAAGAAWIPLPIVDSVVISSIQTTMVISLYKLWGVVGLDAKTFAIVFVKSLTPVLISFAAGYSTANIIKFFFGLGTIIGGALDTIIATVGTLLIGTVVTAYLSQSVYNRHQIMTEQALKDDVKSFMQSVRFKELVDDVKKLVKDPKNISKMQVLEILDNKT